MKNLSSKIIKLPFGAGRILLGYEREGCAEHLAGLTFGSNLSAKVYDRFGNFREARDLGSGLVTNCGVLALANEFSIAGVSGAPINLFALMKYHSSGTGVSAAAATDIKLGTAITTIAAAVVAGTQVLVSAANLQKYQSVATITYDAAGPYNVTEWGLFAGATLVSTTGTPWTAGSGTSGTVTGTPLTASSTTVQGKQQNIALDTTSATPHWGHIVSNSTSVVTVPAWYKISDGTAAGTNPLNTESLETRPVMWDRKQFTAVAVSNGDSIQFTYTLTCTAGG